MMPDPVDLSSIRSYAIRERGHKVRAAQQAGCPPRGAAFAQWWESLPPYLGAASLRKLAQAIVAARQAGRGVAWALGAHVVKVGCAPIVIDLIQKGWVSAVAMNGATAIHDFELATFGETSEEVADTIRDGRFGMVRETADFFAEAIRAAAQEGRGLGAAVGRLLHERRPAAGAASGPADRFGRGILGAAFAAGIPATVHVAFGTDTIHMHPQIDAAALGAATAVDFRLACAVVGGLGAASGGAVGGVWCNIGSAVLLPEVFLKAVSVARNLGHNLDAMITANLDMQSHYRPRENVIGRPVSKGHGLQIVGQHEILLPLLRQAIVELGPD